MGRLPDYLKRPIIDTDATRNVRRILKHNCLTTVCENARCPNKNECYSNNTATFLVMGEFCTRNCKYCNIKCEKPLPLDLKEPKNVAKAVKELGLSYAVITSVTRDDLVDGGANHFVQIISEIRSLTPEVKIEILTPDFKGDIRALEAISAAKPDVFNHNIETVRDLFENVRPQASYNSSLQVLSYMKQKGFVTKSGLMVGLGESFDQIEATLKDLRAVGCDIVTIGQYIQPSKKHLCVSKYYTLEEFDLLKKLAKSSGLERFQVGPLVRSSYRAVALAECL